MKKYMVFAGDAYYPIGGWEDFKGTFDLIEEARERARVSSGDWFQIVETDTGKVVESRR